MAASHADAPAGSKRIQAGSRLVWACSHSPATAPITCSQLSSTSSSCCRASTRATASAAGTPRLLPDPQRRRHYCRNLHRVLHGRQFRQKYPVREPARHLPGHLAGQPGLARTARPGHRHQPVLPEQPGDLAHRPGPSDEARQRSREAMNATRRGDRPRPPHAGTITASRRPRTDQPRPAIAVPHRARPRPLITGSRKPPRPARHQAAEPVHRHRSLAQTCRCQAMSAGAPRCSSGLSKAADHGPARLTNRDHIGPCGRVPSRGGRRSRPP